MQQVNIYGRVGMATLSWNSSDIFAAAVLSAPLKLVIKFVYVLPRVTKATVCLQKSAVLLCY